MKSNSLIQLLFTFFFLLLFTIPVIAQSTDNEKQLKEADNLFVDGKYTEALKLYTQLYQNSEKASPRMLRRLAFIHEGLDNYTEALYYLSLLYRYAPDNQTLLHMEEIAQRYHLKGYEHSDFDFLRALYHRYFFEIVLLLLGFSLLAFGYFFWQTFIWQQVIWSYRIILFIFLILAFFAIRTHHTNKQVIVSKDQSYLMTGPSGASSLKTVVDRGHRMLILDKEDIWYQVEWEDEIVYIRDSQVLTVN